MTRHLAIVTGGEPGEHEVSLASANNVRKLLRALGHEVAVIGASRDGQWYSGAGTLEFLLAASEQDQLPVSARSCEPSCGETPQPGIFGRTIFGQVDLVVPVMHGRFGEDGTLQRHLDRFGLPYLGSGPSASRLCFDKPCAKQAVQAAGLEVVEGFLARRGEPLAVIEARRRQLLGDAAAFIKPCRSGSSRGISKVSDCETLATALETAFAFDSAALVERAVDHVEYVVGVVEINGQLEATPPGQCLPFGSLYSYDEKYIIGNAGFTCPAPIDPALALALQVQAKQAFIAAGCRDFARVDFFVTHASGKIYFNEINTIPGMTGSSVFPQVLKAGGFDLDRMFEMLIENRMEKSAQRR